MSAAPIEFITACSWLESVSGKNWPPVSLAIAFRRFWASVSATPVLKPITYVGTLWTRCPLLYVPAL